MSARRWIIAVPVFGFDYADKFVKVTLPRLMACLEGFERADRRVEWVVHTDRPDDVQQWIPGAHCVRVPGTYDYDNFVRGHREAWEFASDGDAVVFLCADLIPSKDAFFFANRALADGYRAIVAAGIRTLAPEPPRVGAEAEELLEFSMRYPHPIVRETFFPTGGSENPTNVYFRRGDSVVLRGFHLHPFVAVKRQSDFIGTVDYDLLEAFEEDEILVVKNREMALVEMSPATKSSAAGCKPFRIEDVMKAMDLRAKPMHRKFIEHRIRILGDADCADAEAFAAHGVKTR